MRYAAPSSTIASPLVESSRISLAATAATSTGSMSRPPGLSRANASMASSRDRALVGHVEQERHRRHPEAGDRRRRRFHLIGRPRGDRDGATFPGQRQRDLTADAASGAGDERDRLTGRIRHGLSAQNRKKSGRLVDALSRPESVRQRTRGGPLLDGRLALDDGLDDEDAQPASARNSNSSASEHGRRFMRPFYRGIRYI